MVKSKETNITAARSASVSIRTRMFVDAGARDVRECEIVAFDGLEDGKEHVALIYPAPKGANPEAAPLVRIHSECLTGDVLGSVQCDCGAQLNEAKRKMREGGGILLYLRQEGRGVGLYQKLQSYKIQNEQGLDTFEAGKKLGHQDDVRNFQIAADMLAALGISEVQLLTNNPQKVQALRDQNINVSKIIPTGYFARPANQSYLDAKHKKGHVLLKPRED
jgi:GTP cyclohydrolase II